MSAALEPTPASAVTLHIGDNSTKTGRYREYISTVIGGDDDNDDGYVEQIIDIGDGMLVRCILAKDHLFIAPEAEEFPWYSWGEHRAHEGEDLATFKVVGKGRTKEVSRSYQWWGEAKPDRWGYRHSGHQSKRVKQVDCYLPGQIRTDYAYHFKPTDPRRVPYIYVTMDITAFGQTVQEELRFRLPDTGKVTIEKDDKGLPQLKVDVEVFGIVHTFRNNFEPSGGGVDYSGGVGNEPLKVLYDHISRSTIDQGVDGLWAVFLARHTPANPPMAGLASLYKRKAFKPNLERLEKEAPLDWAFLRWLQDVQNCEGRKNNQLIAAMLKKCATDFDTLVRTLQTARHEAHDKTSEWSGYYGYSSRDGGFPAKRAICLELPGAAEMVYEQDAKKNFRIRKTAAGQADGLGVTPDNIPLMEEGWYEVRRCKSYENNPAGIWSLTID
jgi:hypothetical protein